MITADDFDCAIFDLDGTLIDSNRVWEKIDRMYMQKKGIPVSQPELDRMAAMTYEECAEFIKKKGVDIPVDEIKAEFNRLAVSEYRHNIFLKPNAKEFLMLLGSKGKKIALATASPRELYEPVLRHNGIYSFFDAFCTTDEAGREKDSPEVYLMAAERAGAYPGDCAVFEDTLKGLASAAGAGMYTIGVYDRYSGADAVAMRNIADRFIMDFSEMMINL